MFYRKLGRTDLEVSSLGFGCMRLPHGEKFSDIDIEETYKMFDYAIEHGVNYFDLAYRALPEVHKDEIDLSSEVFGKKLDSPLFITAITGGHPESRKINKELAIVAENRGIGLGLGSQRAAIAHPELADTYNVAREYAPNALLLGNIGAPQSDLAGKAIEI